MPKRFGLTQRLPQPIMPVMSTHAPLAKATRRQISAAVAALAVQLPATAIGGNPPREIRMLPAGAFRAVDGRPQGLDSWRIDHELAQPIVAAAAARQSDYVIDYEHQTLLARENGKPAPAAGWYRRLEWRPDGLWATDVQWTPAATAMIVGGEYRYVSPVFGYDLRSGEVRTLACAALVSNPGLDGLTDLCSSIDRLAADLFTQPEKSPMEDLEEQLRWLLNLPLSSTTDEIAAELQKIIDQLRADQPAAAAAGFCLAGYLRQQTDRLTALSASLDQLTDPGQYVAVAALHAVQAELDAVRSEQAKARVQQVIDAALASAKLLPAQVTWAQTLGEKDFGSLQAYLDTAVPLVALDSTQTGGKPPTGRVDRQDAHAMARMAQDFQTAEAAAGRHVSIADAVAYVINH